MAMTFRVNLETLNKLSHRQPYTTAEADNFKATRVSYFPDFLLDNHYLTHGQTFQVTGPIALHLKNNYTEGEFKFLDYVSGTAY